MVDQRPHLVVIAIDGVSTQLSGVGVMVNMFFRHAASLEEVGTFQSVSAIGPLVDQSSDDFSRGALTTVKNACSGNNGSVRYYDVRDSSSLAGAWALADPTSWEESSRSAVRALDDLDLQGDILIVVHGIMLAPLHSFLSESIADRSRVVYVAHSLGRAGADSLSSTRVKWEDRAFSALRPQDRIAYVSESTHALLADVYCVDEHHLIPMLNGVHAPDYEGTEVDSALDRHTIKRGGRYLFSWGRGVPSKGFDIILEAWHLLASSGELRDDDKLILLVPLETSPKDYAQRLRELAASIPESNLHTIWEFDSELPAAVLSSPELSTVIFASEFESYMLTAAEALLLCPPSVQHVYYDIPPLREQYRGMQNSHPVNVRTPEGFSKELKQVLSGGLPEGIPSRRREFVEEIQTFFRALDE